MSNAKLKTQAQELRKEGYSYNLISERTSISKSTLSYWLANIPYTPNKKVIERIGKARAKSGEVKQRQKQKTLELAKKQAVFDIGSINNRDLFMLGIGLYIGEGSKNDIIAVINSDPRVINLAIRWFKEVCGLDTGNLTLAIHLYPDNNREACLKYWSQISVIPLSQFGKTQIDHRKGKKLGKRGHLPYGTAHLRVRSNGNKEFGVLLSRRIHAWMERVLQGRV